TKVVWLKKHAHALEGVGGFYTTSTSLTSRGEPEQVPAARVTGDFFSILGITPALGRGFLPEEDAPGGPDVALLSNSFWQSHFGGDPGLIGKAVSFDGRNVTIVGILPASFRFPFRQPEPQAWFPRVFENTLFDQPRIQQGAAFLTVFGRMRAGITLQQAQADLNGASATYSKENPGFADSKFALDTMLLQESLVGDSRPALIVLLAAVGLVLLIGCANVASLLLARATAREREIAIRRALGASRPRLIRQLLTESLLLAILGGALGIGLASWGLRLARALPAGTVPRLEEVRLNGSVLGFTCVLCLFTGIAFGLVPSFQAARRDLHDTLKEGSRGSTGGARSGRSRATLVVIEVAVAVVLATGAGLLIRSFQNLMKVNPGFDAHQLRTFEIDLPPALYPLPVQRADFFRRLLEQVRALPGVQSAGVISYLPMGGPVRFVYFCAEGAPCQGIGKDPVIAFRQTSPNFMHAMRIPRLRGRDFSESDIAGAKPVAIINEFVAKNYFKDRDPIGQHIANSRDMTQHEIVGVVADVKFNGLSVPYFAEMYFPEEQLPYPQMTLVVRSGLPGQALVDS
ncbi:MAG: ABC transporter permease, partial [Bryobacteraceae bacterium]